MYLQALADPRTGIPCQVSQKTSKNHLKLYNDHRSYKLDREYLMVLHAWLFNGHYLQYLLAGSDAAKWFMSHVHGISSVEAAQVSCLSQYRRLKSHYNKK